MRRHTSLYSLIFSLVLTATLAALPARAQFGILERAAEEIAKNTDISSLLEGEPPIKTGLEHAIHGDASMDGLAPETFASLTSLTRTPSGGFLLASGYYEMSTQSYCLKAGTHGPGGGDGYLYAPPMGTAEEAVVSILRNSVQHPGIAQSDIQMLLWAIIARAKFEDLSSDLKMTAARLLTPNQIASLNRNAFDMVPGPVLDRAIAEAPPAVRAVLEAEAQLRQMLTSTTSSFAEMERVAVLSGAAPMGEGSRAVPSGRWSLHPDGYHVRYLPSGYSQTRVQIWVPQGSPAVGREYDPSLHIAVPGNTSRQRLIQSGRQRI